MWLNGHHSEQISTILFCSSQISKAYNQSCCLVMAVKSLKRHKLDYVLRISDGQNLFAQALTCVVNIHQRNGNSVLYPQPLFFFAVFFFNL